MIAERFPDPDDGRPLCRLCREFNGSAQRASPLGVRLSEMLRLAGKVTRSRDVGRSQVRNPKERNQMAANSKIEWTTHMLNPGRGCSAFTDGNCYAEATSKRNETIRNMGAERTPSQNRG